MTTYVVERTARGKIKIVEKGSRRLLNATGVHVISDEMPATRHMADGQYYTSKAKFRAATRAAGCIEVGNETKALLAPRKPTMPTREQRRDAIRTALRRQLAGQPY